MTRRIALAILLTVWAVLILGGAAAYFAARQVLLEELDRAAIARATALPQILGVERGDGSVTIPSTDRYVIRDAAGQTLSRVDAEPGRTVSHDLLGTTFTQLGDGRRLRTVTLVVRTYEASGIAGPPYTIIYSMDARHYDRLLNRLLMVLGIVAAIGGALTAGVAIYVARSALRPLNATAATVGQIDEKKLDRRVDVASLPPELAPMAQRLNEMLARLEGGFLARKQFLADAAHELRTPVAALMTTLEVALRRPRDATALTDILRRCLTDARFLSRLVESLLEVARSERPSHAQVSEPTDVGRILEECATIAESLGSAKGVRIERQIESAPTMTLPPARLRSVVMNLLGNAVEYGRAEGCVILRSEQSAGQLQISVSDDGKGIDPEHLPHLFEPFYRADRAREQETSHLGLGLFLVRSHVAAMGGTIRAENRPEGGARFVVNLPMFHVEQSPVSAEDWAIQANEKQSLTL